MCHLSIALGQIRLGADQKRIFLTAPMFVFLFFFLIPMAEVRRYGGILNEQQISAFYLK